MIAVLPLDVARWDETPRDTLVLTSFVDERPLRGAAGLADWRLCGRLSRLIKRDRARGTAGETLMMPPGARLAFAKVLWFGLGDAAGYGDERMAQDLRHVFAVARKACVRDLAMQLPGRATGLVGARRALELVLAELGDTDDLNLAIIEDAAGQRDIADLSRQYGIARV